MAIPPTIEIATLGMSDSLFLMLLALVVFGPRRLPQIGRQIGKLMYEFRKASNDFKFQMEEELRNSEEAERRKKEEAERQKALAAGTPAALPQPFTGGYMNAPVEAPSDTPGESEGLRIQPPSTGEQIPSAPPTRMAQESQATVEPTAEAVAGSEAGQAAYAAEMKAVNEASQPAATATDQVGAATEQESQHG
ncbi:MAG TPA: twin-arginine translocase TatA/TatE family subunit [Terracidiphilus sp.]|nr:twin-arginine translocase TatA/TatE family subunit [Terracidiphilus sp.]